MEEMAQVRWGPKRGQEAEHVIFWTRVLHVRIGRQIDTFHIFNHHCNHCDRNSGFLVELAEVPVQRKHCSYKSKIAD